MLLYHNNVSIIRSFCRMRVFLIDIPFSRRCVTCRIFFKSYLSEGSLSGDFNSTHHFRIITRPRSLNITTTDGHRFFPNILTDQNHFQTRNFRRLSPLTRLHLKKEEAPRPCDYSGFLKAASHDEGVVVHSLMVRPPMENMALDPPRLASTQRGKRVCGGVASL